ncbi:MAG: tetratricopeptide repeat protein [Bacteroidetes bacterium]|nr:tetratricopeptide repeat protein [Bacteroidota bacterium]
MTTTSDPQADIPLEAQMSSAEIDLGSIEAEIAVAEGDPNTLDAIATRLILAARASLGHDDMSAALHLCDRALQISSATANVKGIAVARSTMGIALASAGSFPEALEHMTAALQTAQELGEDERIAAELHNIARLFEQTGDLPAALEYLHRAFEINVRRGNTEWQAHNLSALATVHQQSGDDGASLDLFKRARELYHQRNDVVGITKMDLNIGATLLRLEQFDKAHAVLEEALRTAESAGLHALHLHATVHLGAIHLGIGNIDAAQACLNSVADVDIADPQMYLLKCELDANIRLARNDVDGAYDVLITALEEAVQQSRTAFVASFHEQCRELAKRRGDFEGYVRHNDEFMKANDVLRGRQTTTRLVMHAKQREIDDLQQHRERERAILFATLPKQVADRIIRGEDVSGDDHDNAAVLFCDIVGFTTQTAALGSTIVTALLGQLFASFDTLCERYAITKVKTIGDAYMAVAFSTNDTDDSPSRRIAAFSLAMLDHGLTWPSGEPLHIRIGIHCGPVTAGVIGTERLQYDVWGDTVNVASRMESSGEKGRIHVSAAFATELDLESRSNDKGDGSGLHEFLIEERGTIDVKGKGSMVTCWLREAGRPTS